ncbi:MAG: arylsulfatase [Planctomycetota bacterium]
MKALALFACLTAMACFSCTSTTEGPSGTSAREWSPPNIVLIMADDMGFSDIGCYGGEVNTPNIDALAAKGVRFTQFANAGRCCPSRASLLTGRYPHAVGMGWMTAVDEGIEGYRGQIASDVPTVAEILGEAGYATAMSGKWHLTVDGSYQGLGAAARPNGSWPTERGFDRYYGGLSGGGGFYRPTSIVDQETRVLAEDLPDGYYYTHATTDAAVDFIDELMGDDPLFLYVAYYAPHRPLQAPEERVEPLLERYEPGYDALRQARFDRMVSMGIVPEGHELPPAVNAPRAWDEWPEQRQTKWVREMATYAAMIEIMDDGIGEIVDAIDAKGELENTIFVFLSDNGATDEGGPVSRLAADLSNTPYMLYKKRTKAGGVRSPLIVSGDAVTRLPSTMLPGSLFHVPSHVVDLTPMILGYAGVLDGGEFDGRNIACEFTGLDCVSTRSLTFWEHEGNRAVRDDRWKAVATGVPGAWALYDLATDPFEQIDLATTESERLASLTSEWNAWAEANSVLPVHHEGWYKRIDKYKALVPDQSGTALSD